MHSEFDTSANLTILVHIIPDKRTTNPWRKSLIYVRDEKALSYLECRANLRLLPSEFKNTYHSRQKSPIFGVKSCRFWTKEPYRCELQSELDTSTAITIQIRIILVFGLQSRRFSTKEPYNMWDAERTWYVYCPPNSNTNHSRQNRPIFWTKEP